MMQAPLSPFIGTDPTIHFRGKAGLGPALRACARSLEFIADLLPARTARCNPMPCHHPKLLLDPPPELAAVPAKPRNTQARFIETP